MGSVWNRDVEVVSGACPNGTETHHLKVTKSAQNPDPPGHTQDTATDIYVTASDRGQGGAKLNYHVKTQGLDLTGIEPDDQNGLSANAQGGGNLLVLTDTGGKGVTYTYLVVGTYNNATIKTCDPQIHNEEEE